MLLQKEIHLILGQLVCILNFSYIFIGIITTPSDLPAYLKQIVFTTHLLIHRKWILHPLQLLFCPYLCGKYTVHTNVRFVICKGLLIMCKRFKAEVISICFELTFYSKEFHYGKKKIVKLSKALDHQGVNDNTKLLFMFIPFWSINGSDKIIILCQKKILLFY